MLTQARDRYTMERSPQATVIIKNGLRPDSLEKPPDLP